MTISLDQAMRNAIEAERSAARFYDQLISHARDAETRQFFGEMATQEREHADAIEEMAKKIGEIAPRAGRNVELVETAPGWASVENITLDQALGLALEAEISAALYYDALADFCDAVGKEFFERMVRCEEEHATKLRKVIAKRKSG